jgi:hypothetical protein
MQKINIKMKGRRESNKEQKRKSALISMNVPGPTAPESPNSNAMKLISAKQSPMSARRASSVKKEEKPKLVRVVSVEEEAVRNLHENFQAPVEPQEDPNGIPKEDPTITPQPSAVNDVKPPDEEESGSFHEDLDRLGHAIRSLSFRLPATLHGNMMRSNAGEDANWQHASTTSQNPFEIPTENHEINVLEITRTDQQNPFDFAASNAEAADTNVKNEFLQNPFEDTHTTSNRNLSPVFMEGYPMQDFSQSNPFDDAGASPFHGHSPIFPTKSAPPNFPITPETTASSLNPFDVSPDFSSPADASHLQVPLHGEKVLLVPPNEIETSFDVPVDGQRMLMTSVSDVDDDFDVPLDGARVMMSPYSSHDHGNETTDDEGDYDSHDEDEISTMKFAIDILGTEHPAATDRFSFC